MVKNLPCNAGTRGGPLVWEDPICCEEVSPQATTTEAQESRVCYTTREATAMRNQHTAAKSSSYSLQLEKAHTATKTQRCQKQSN